MTCLVCDNAIRINTLQQLFALQPLLLCSICSQHLISKSDDVLYEDNEWIRSVIHRLNLGDLALVQLFKKNLQKALLKTGATPTSIKIIEGSENLPYPWLEILVDDIMASSKCKNLTPSKTTLVIAVEKQKNIKYQILLIG